MNRKFLVWLLTVVLLTTSFAQAQQPAKVAKIGLLGFGSAVLPSGRESLVRELRALGYVEGKNLAFVYRFANNKIERFPALADELVGLKVDVIITPGTPAALAAKNATRTIPIVFIGVADPVPTGLVDSLARPGGNITGFTDISEVLAGQAPGATQGNYSKTISRHDAVESAQSWQ